MCYVSWCKDSRSQSPLVKSHMLIFGVQILNTLMIDLSCKCRMCQWPPASVNGNLIRVNRLFYSAPWRKGREKRKKPAIFLFPLVDCFFSLFFQGAEKSQCYLKKISKKVRNLSDDFMFLGICAKFTFE